MTNTKLTFKIIDYNSGHKQRWKEINEAWITKSYVMEEIDHQHCSFPEESILAAGGQILLAEVDGRIAGTVGLLKDNPDTYELIKMAVDEEYQGLGIGRALCQAAIERAESLGATLLYLFSNKGGSQTAIQLYRKLGFIEVPLDRQDFVRADIKMEMWFPEALERLQFPIGRYQKPEAITSELRRALILEIETLPVRLESALAGWSDQQLDTPYRPGGWTVRQTVHHLADSHINAFCRLRLALTEKQPTIKPYDQNEWAKLADVKELPVQVSLDILKGLHARWTFLLKTLSEGEFQRSYVHPEYGKTYSVEEMVAVYAHHGNHHLAHITGLKERNGWI